MAFDHSTGPNCLAFITYVLNQRLFLYMLVSSNNSVVMALDSRALAGLCRCLLRESSRLLQRAKTGVVFPGESLSKGGAWW